MAVTLLQGGEGYEYTEDPISWGSSFFGEGGGGGCPRDSQEVGPVQQSTSYQGVIKKISGEL